MVAASQPKRGASVRKITLAAILSFASLLVLGIRQSPAQVSPTPTPTATPTPTWGFSCSGDINETGHPFMVLVGVMKATGATTFTGSSTYNDAGSVFPETFAASMSSFSDGHFTMTFSFTSGTLSGMVSH